jgi:hypothetical protein
MAKTANSYILPQDNRIKTAILTAAKVTYNDLTNAVKICDAGANGSLIKEVWALPRASVTATQLQLYAYDGATAYLIASALMALYTFANTTEITRTTFAKPTDDYPLYIPSGWSLYGGAAVALAGGIAMSARIEDY